MKAGTDEPILRYRLAVAYEASRQPKKAAEALRALLEGPHQFPQRADAERMLSRLQGEGNSQ